MVSPSYVRDTENVKLHAVSLGHNMALNASWSKRSLNAKRRQKDH